MHILILMVVLINTAFCTEKLGESSPFGPIMRPGGKGLIKMEDNIANEKTMKEHQKKAASCNVGNKVQCYNVRNHQVNFLAYKFGKAADIVIQFMQRRLAIEKLIKKKPLLGRRMSQLKSTGTYLGVKRFIRIG